MTVPSGTSGEATAQVPIGLYKGEPVATLEDVNYIVWFLESVRGFEPTKDAMRARLSELEAEQQREWMIRQTAK